MKATKYLSMAALALMGVLASCQSDDEAVSIARPNNAVSVNFSVGSLQGTTRSNAAATDDTQRQFNVGDQISVSTNDQEAVLFQCTSTENQTWTEAEANKFLLWTQPMLTFSAYYPLTTGTSMTGFTLPTDQSSVENIALADYMTRQQIISRPESGSNIQMQLERKMARVIVRISGFGDQYDDDEKTVSNVRIYSQASGIADSDPTGSIAEITPYAQGNGGLGSTYTALVVPGDGNSNANFIRLRDGELNTLLVKGIPAMQAGHSYTFNLVVGKNRIEVASVTVQDWATGEILSGGQAEEVSVIDNGYLKWNADQKKLVATEIPTTATTVQNSTENVEWAGTYVVENDVTISGEIKLTGDVELIIKDGVKLTVNKIIHTTSGASLSVYGQTEMSGELNVTNVGADAIFALNTFAVHSCKVRATSPASGGGGIYNTTTINVYGGLLEAEYTGASNGYGIQLRSGGSMNIYGGEVKAIGKGDDDYYSFGIKTSNNSTGFVTVTVYGGKLWTESGYKALSNVVTLTTGDDFTGTIEYSSDNNDWSDAADVNAKYIRVGY